jgi:hypothetical protein
MLVIYVCVRALAIFHIKPDLSRCMKYGRVSPHMFFVYLVLRCVRKSTKNDYIVLSVRKEQLGFHWTGFHNILCVFFRKSVENEPSFVKIWQRWRLLNAKTLIHELCISFVIFPRMGDGTDRSSRENQNTFLFNKFFLQNLAMYEILWKYMVEPNRPYLTV